jgi:hypothetical protein
MARRVRDEDDEDDEDFFYDRFGHRRRRRPKPPPKPLWLKALGCLALGYVIWLALLILAGGVGLFVMLVRGSLK